MPNGIVINQMPISLGVFSRPVNNVAERCSLSAAEKHVVLYRSGIVLPAGWSC